jgi:glycosyltransferase involved in cell wall biosynthesis
MRISVCIPTFNGEKYIKQQLESILIQLNDSDEIIISDDSSTDKTIEIIKSFGDTRIHIIENCHFKSPIFNLENALKHAKGDYIILSDQDDIWLKDKVFLSLRYLNVYDLVVHDCEIIDENENLLMNSYFKLRNSRKGFLKNFYKSSYLGCCMAFRASMLKYYLPFPKSIVSHDMWIGLVSEFTGKILFTNEKLIQYRRHGNNVSIASEQSNFSILFRINYRFKIFINILLHLFIRSNK